MEFTIIILAAIGFIALMGGAFWLSHIHAKKRREDLANVAAEMGLTYAEVGDSNILSMLSAFKVFNTGHSRQAYNVIQGITEEVSIVILDYTYVVGSGKNKSRYTQSVVYLESNSLQSPSFTMRPENLFDKIGGALGFQDIDFDEFPLFSKSFVLKSPNEKSTRTFFCAELIQFFEARTGICVEANPGSMIFYRSNKSVQPKDIKSMFSEAYETYGIMVDVASGKIGN